MDADDWSHDLKIFFGLFSFEVTISAVHDVFSAKELVVECSEILRCDGSSALLTGDGAQWDQIQF